MGIKLGITGGIGSGKSVVSHLFRIMGIPVYLTDDEAKRLTNEDAEIRRELTDLVGAEVYLPDGTLNRPYLATYLFANETHATKVNSIIHPRVKRDFIQWTEAHAHHPVVAVESAILIEAGFTETVDQIVMVYAPLELRLQRAMLRDNASEEQIRNRIQRQMSDEEKCQKAHQIIINDDKTPVIPQIRTMLEKLCPTHSAQPKTEEETCIS